MLLLLSLPWCPPGSIKSPSELPTPENASPVLPSSADTARDMSPGQRKQLDDLLKDLAPETREAARSALFGGDASEMTARLDPYQGEFDQPVVGLTALCTMASQQRAPVVMWCSSRCPRGRVPCLPPACPVWRLPTRRAHSPCAGADYHTHSNPDPSLPLHLPHAQTCT